MTTIAFDGKTIACDTQTSTFDSPSTKNLNFIKGRVINTPSGKALVIASGYIDDYLAALPDLQEGKKPMLTEDESEIIMVMNSTVYAWQAGPVSEQGAQPKKVQARLVPVYTSDTWGSGASFAETVLRMGGSAAQAVATAINIDLYSGGQVLAWDVATLKPIKVSSKMPRIVKEGL